MIDFVAAGRCRRDARSARAAGNSHRLDDDHRGRLLHLAGHPTFRRGPSRDRLRRAQPRRAEDRVRPDRRRPQAPQSRRNRAIHGDVVRQHSRQRPCHRERGRRARGARRSGTRRVGFAAKSPSPIRWWTASRRRPPIASATCCAKTSGSKTIGRCSARSSGNGCSRISFPPAARLWSRPVSPSRPMSRPIELMKMRILNGGHAAIAYPAALLDIHFVHEAMEDAQINAFLEKLTKDEIIPTVPPPSGVDLEDYRSLIARRFANPKIGDTITRSVSTAPTGNRSSFLPTAADRRKSNASLDGLALVSALWCRYCYGETESGKAIAPNDPSWDRIQARARDKRATTRKRTSRWATFSAPSRRTRPTSLRFRRRFRRCGQRRSRDARRLSRRPVLTRDRILFKQSRHCERSAAIQQRQAERRLLRCSARRNDGSNASPPMN